MVPEQLTEKPPPKPAHKPKPTVAVQENGLPEGVTILPVTADPDVAVPAGPAPEKPVEAASEPPVERVAPNKPTQDLIQQRTWLQPAADAAAAPKRRKPGRPKAGRLDIPRIAAQNTPAPLPAAPVIAKASGVADPPPATAVRAGSRSMSDIARPTAHTTRRPAHEAESSPEASKPQKTKRARAHRVGVAPLHYAPVIAFSFRARARPRLIGLAALGASSLGVAAAYGAWLVLAHGVWGLADDVIHAGPKLAIEAGLLVITYYIGRSLGQTAITYGIAREADQRPVTLSRQFGVAVNTFGRRLMLDISFGIGELILLAGGTILFITGGETWPVNPNLQLGLIFTAYIVLLYFFAASAISRGLAGVNLTLTTDSAGRAAKVGWQLFSHRVELVGPRFLALVMELVLAVPLIVLCVALVLSAPAQYQILATVGVGILAWLAGALLGVGTAAWWAMLYRQLVIADRPGDAVALLSSRQPEDAHAAPLALVVSVSTLIIAAIMLLPWVRLG